MRRAAAFSCALVAVTFAAALSAQSLGQVAERERKPSPKPGKVYTEEDLARAQGTGSFPQPGPSASPTAPTEGAQLAARLRELMGQTLRSAADRQAAEEAAGALLRSNVLAGRTRKEVEDLLGGSQSCPPGIGSESTDVCYPVGKPATGTVGALYLVVGFAKDGSCNRAEATRTL